MLPARHAAAPRAACAGAAAYDTNYAFANAACTLFLRAACATFCCALRTHLSRRCRAHLPGRHCLRAARTLSAHYAALPRASAASPRAKKNGWKNFFTAMRFTRYTTPRARHGGLAHLARAHTPLLRYSLEKEGDIATPRARGVRRFTKRKAR